MVSHGSHESGVHTPFNEREADMMRISLSGSFCASVSAHDTPAIPPPRTIYRYEDIVETGGYGLLVGHTTEQTGMSDDV